jgi:glycosidase
MAMLLRCPRFFGPFGCALWAATLGCSGSTPPSSTAPLRDCPRALWAQPSRPGADIRVIGSWDGWKEPGTAMKPRSDGWYTTRVEVAEGEYGYVVSENGQQRIDVFNPLTTFRGDDEVSLLLVPACATPAIHVDEIDVAEGRAAGASVAIIRATFLRGRSGALLASRSVSVVSEAAASAAVTLVQGTVSRAEAATGALAIAVSGLGRGNNIVRVMAEDEQGQRVEQPVSVWVEPRAISWADAVIYQIFIDRFRTSEGGALSPPSSPGLRAGGTLDGVRAELEKGTFDALGVSALWLSPPATTPDESRIGRSGRLEEAYHGYWQLDTRAVDPRLGGDTALDQLIESAHRRGIRILIDIVPNHIYENHPRYLLHRQDGWFHQDADKCVCGEAACSWSTHIERCWFTDFLPDYRFQNSEVMRQTAADAAYWVKRFHVDGVRIDAVPMMPRAVTRRIVAGLRGAVAPDPASFALGEIFTGPDGLGTIRHYLGPDGLSSAFDFPLMWALREAVAKDSAGFGDVDAVLERNERAIEGASSLWARMLDNHDTSRFLSEAAGDGQRHAWDDPPADPDSDIPYQRLELGLALLFTLPGIPVLYYGDELGLGGATDPDSRRVMPDLALLSARQRRVLHVARKLGRLRSTVEALRTGTRQTLLAERDVYVFIRAAANGSMAMVLLSKSGTPATIVVAPDALSPGIYADAMSDTRYDVEEAMPVEVSMAPFSFRVLTPLARDAAR